MDDIDLSGQDYRAIIDAATVPIAISRISDGKILFVNKHVEKFLAMPASKIVGRSTIEFYQQPEKGETVLGIIQRDGRLEDMRIGIRTGDGDWVWATVNGTPTDFAGFECMLVVL
ncbi:unnamed protein product, partial [Ectocarpus sp. 12 AP-2014]